MRALRLPLQILCFLALLAGCAAVPPPASSVPVSLESLDHWEAHGRIGIVGPERGGSGSFDWRQRQDESIVQIRGPVGIGSVQLQVRGDAANPELELQTGDGVRLESQAAWAELETQLGAALPAGNLRYWLLGLPAPGTHQWSEPDESGRVSLNQQGWHIEYQRYSNESGARLPVRLRATSGEAQVRIVIDRWQLGR